MRWLEDEPRLITGTLQQVRRLICRALQRPIITVGVALGISTVLFAAQVKRPKAYEREVGLLITEGAFAADGRPRPRGELLGFIDRAVFTASNLGELVVKHDLARKLRAPTPKVALDRLRQRIDVGIWQDYFQGYREGKDPPRTVRVTIGFSAPDPDTALAVARDLGQLVAETQTQGEVDSAAERVKAKRILAESAGARATSLHEEYERMKADALAQPGGNLFVGLQSMNNAVKAAEETAAALSGELVDAQLRERAVRRLGHLVQVVDPGTPLWQMLSRTERLARQAALSLGLGVFLSVFLVGGVEPTIKDEQDLRRVRIPYLGSIPAGSDDALHEV